MASDVRWTAERPTGISRAERLIAARFPELRGLRLAPLAEGWDNTVFVVGGSWVFRFPRRRIALPGGQRELAVLPQVAERLSLPVPVPTLVSHDDDPVEPWPFTGARLIPGTELAETALPGERRGAAAAAVGRFLRELHAPRTRAVADVNLPVDPMQRAWPRPRLEETRRQLRRLASEGTWRADPRVERLLDEAQDLDAPVGEPALVHGDLHVRHVLLDAAGLATGVIDWGDVCLADPAVDLSIAYGAFAGRARTSFFAEYGTVDAERELRARALAVRLSSVLAAYAASVGNRVLLAEALAGLSRVVD
jgi:aminoglycoside phosphotransferase (APT) family kinase protein